MAFLIRLLFGVKSVPAVVPIRETNHLTRRELTIEETIRRYEQLYSK